MPRQALEVGDIFRACGPKWRLQQQAHLHPEQYKVMSAIERCRTAELGGHLYQCVDCGDTQIAYNSCRNRHCPKCQGSVAKRWLLARQSELLPVDYYHVVFTIPDTLNAIAYQNKALVYSALFQSVSQTLQIIARDDRHLGAKLGAIMVLHTWGSALTHHPHIHCIVPGGGLSMNGEQWIACKKGFFLPVRVLSRLFRRLFLEKMVQAFNNNTLKFYGKQVAIAQPNQFAQLIEPLGKKEWIVYAKRPFAGPKSVLAYLSRYTHRVAIANSRLLSHDEQGVTFKWKDYRLKGRTKYKMMTLTSDEFMRRFLIHILPKGFHRIRHIGILSNPVRKASLANIRQLITAQSPDTRGACASRIEVPAINEPTHRSCKVCGADMTIIEFFVRGNEPRGPPVIRDAA